MNELRDRLDAYHKKMDKRSNRLDRVEKYQKLNQEVICLQCDQFNIY